jgi:hypothetical protein
VDDVNHDAHLFTDTDTGEDAVVFRAGPPTGGRTAGVHLVPHPDSEVRNNKEGR